MSIRNLTDEEIAILRKAGDFKRMEGLWERRLALRKALEGKLPAEPIGGYIPLVRRANP